MAAKGLKTRKNESHAIAFIEAIENDQTKKGCKRLIRTMRKISGHGPSMWGSSIVGFGSYHYPYDSGREGDFFCADFLPAKGRWPFISWRVLAVTRN